MKIDHKLKLNALIVLSLLTISVGVAIFLVDGIKNNVRQMAEVDQPLEQAILEMEINVGETARAVLDYIQDFEQDELDAIQDSEHDFERYAETFERLAETDEERVLGEKVANIYREFKTLGDQITSLAKRRSDDLGIFLKDVEIIDALIDDKLQPAIERTAPDALTKLEAALDMEINIHEAFAAIEGYVLHPDPQLRQKIADSEADFERFEAQYRATRLTADEMKWLDQIDKAFAEAVTAGNEIIRLTDEMRGKLARFEADLEEIDHILDDQIQPLILAETQRAAKDAEEAGETAVAVMLFLGSLIFITMGSMSWYVSKGIIDGVGRLSEGASAFGRGNLDFRIEAPTEDELGVLAGALNEMAAKRKVDEEALAESEQRITTIVENITDGIVTINEAGIIQWVNSAAARLFGYESEQLIGQNVKILVPDPFHGEHDAYIRNYRETGQAKIIGIGREVEGQRRNGSTFPMELEIAEIRFKDERLFLGVTKDITERKEMDRMKAEFISTVSHELRTPLTSIRGSLGLVTSGALGEMPKKVGRMIELAENNTTRLISLVNDLLDMEKLQSGELVFHMEKESLTEIVSNSLETNKPFADDRKVKFKLTETVSDAVVRGDGDRLAQVMANLLSNAIKFSPEGETVEISLTRREDGFRIIVSDRGPGVPDEFRDKLFERFAQADSSDNRQKGGTGLGLNISKVIVEAHGGEIGFDPTPGKGAVFYVDLPDYGKYLRELPSPVAPDERADKPKVIEGHRILVIEDNPDVAGLIAIMLEQYGAVCDTVHDVAEARKKLADTTYQVITLDIILPDGSGIAFLQELRHNDATKDIPVVVVSAVAHESREEVLTSIMGVMDWLDKPIDEKRLVRAVKRGTDLSADGHNKILIVEDDADLTEVLAKLIGGLAEVTVTATLEQAKVELEMAQWSLVILDIGLPDGSGLDLIPLLKNEGRPPTPVIIFSADEVSNHIAGKVEHALVKSRTSNEDLLAMIEAMISKVGENVI